MYILVSFEPLNNSNFAVPNCFKKLGGVYRSSHRRMANGTDERYEKVPQIEKIAYTVAQHSIICNEGRKRNTEATVEPCKMRSPPN